MENSELWHPEQGVNEEPIKEVHSDSVRPETSEPEIEAAASEVQDTVQNESADSGERPESDGEKAEEQAVPNTENSNLPEDTEPPKPAEDTLHALPSRYQRDILVERIGQKKRYKRTLITTITIMLLIAGAAVYIAMILCPVIKISGSGMEPAYQSGDILLLLNVSDYSSGDLICISYQNKLLVKRVIARSGDSVYIDENGNVSVNGQQIDEPYAVNKGLGECDIEFPLAVPEGTYFVLGDKRDTSIDSRSTLVGCVSDDDVVGKVLIKVWPLDKQ